jgi:hypothetical protein
LAAQGLLAAARGFVGLPAILAPHGFLGAQGMRVGAGLHGAPLLASRAKDGVASAAPMATVAPRVSAALRNGFMRISGGGVIT